MLPSPAFPEDLLPETIVFTAFKTGHHFDSYDAFFEHLVGRKFPPPSAKPKEKGAAGASIVWHERNLPKSSLTSSDTSLDFHVQLAILYLVPLTPSRSLDQLVDTLNEYLRRRFVKGETILLKRQNKWEPGVISDVRYNGPVLDDFSLDGTRYLPRDFMYDVKPLGSLQDDGFMVDMTCKQIRRQAFDRASMRSCILQHCKCREPRKTSSLWSLKKKTILAYDLNNLLWLDMFAAKEPRFAVQPKASKSFPRKDKDDKSHKSKDGSKKNQKKDKDLGKAGKGSESSKERPSKKRKHEDSGDLPSSKSKKSKSSSLSNGKEKGRSRTLLSSAEKAEKKKFMQQEYKKRWRDKLKMEREKLTNVWAKVFSVGEDMDCPSLKPIPIVPKSLQTLMPEKFIADGLFLMEFLRTFGHIVDKSGAFADMASMDLDRLHKILSSESVDGELTHLLAFCCKAVLSTVPVQPVEREASVMFNSGFQQEGANVISSTKSRLGMSLHSLAITGLTVSEVVRLSLLVACVPVRASAVEAGFDSAILRMLKSQGGSSLYGVIYGQSVFALSFEKRLELIIQMLQTVMESDVVRGVLEEACAGVDENEKALKGLKALNDEAGKIKGKILVSKIREEDRKDQKNDRFRQLLDNYARKRSLRTVEKERRAIELMEDFRVLNEGRKRRKLTEQDVSSLTEAMEDFRSKITIQIKEEREEILAKVKKSEQNFRLEPMGMDRHCFRYWLIPSLSELVIECTQRQEVRQCVEGCLCQTVKANEEQAKESSTWWTLPNDEEDSLSVLSKSLLMGGEREVALKRALEPYLQNGRRSVEIGRQVAVISPTSRLVPQLPSPDVWQRQLADHILATLRMLNHNLLKARLCGIPVEKEELWVDEMKGVVSPQSLLDSAAPSPEIMEPEMKVEPVVVNGHSTPDMSTEDSRTVTDEADKEPEEVSVSGIKQHLMSPQLLKKQHKREGDREEVAEEAASEVQSSVSESLAGENNKVEENKNKNNNVALMHSATPFSSETTILVKRVVAGVQKLLSFIPLRYIGRPLVTISDNKKNLEQFEAWKTSLAQCSFSLSEVALHLSVLESCILWNKSTVNVNCKACRKRGDYSSVACCDRCERKFHLDCVIPPLQEIPQEWWVCPICEPVPVFRNSRRARHAQLDYNDDKTQPSFQEGRRANEEDSTVKLNGEKVSTSSSRQARAMQRNGNSYDLDEEEENAQVQLNETEFDASRRRSGRGKRVDYKELAEGTSQQAEAPSPPIVNGQEGLEAPNGQEMEAEVEAEGEDQVEEVPDYYREKLEEEEEEVSPVESDDSEYDPDDNGRPRWGKTHRKNNKK